LIEITDGVGIAELVLDMMDEVGSCESEIVLLMTTEELDNFDDERVLPTITTEELVVDSFDDDSVLLVTTKELDVVCRFELDVEDVKAVVELIVVHGRTLTVLLKSYIESRFGPPQNSEAFPLQNWNC